MRLGPLVVVVLASGLVAGAALADDRGHTERSDSSWHVPRATEQLVVVTSDGWSAARGKLQRFEALGNAARRSARTKWVPVGEPVLVDLGSAGLGWGRGLLPERFAPYFGGPTKQEGDHRAPAGVFRLVEATGYAPERPEGARLRYFPATPELRCVDDVKSPYYNQLVTAPSDGKTSWSSDEHMRRDDELYRLAIVVEHNRAPSTPGAGSCIFLHVASGQPTVGCTSMKSDALSSLLVWLDPDKRPLLVQLPGELYDAIAALGNLPAR